MTTRIPDERGASFSTFCCGFVVVLILLAGLVVDGGAQITATRRAQVVAAEAARAATDAGARYRLGGADGDQAAASAARRYADQVSDVQASVSVGPDHTVRVQTSTSTSTVFLSFIGITTLRAHGDATADLRR